MNDVQYFDCGGAIFLFSSLGSAWDFLLRNRCGICLLEAWASIFERHLKLFCFEKALPSRSKAWASVHGRTFKPFV
jgi:hypothetical protein